MNKRLIDPIHLYTNNYPSVYDHTISLPDGDSTPTCVSYSKHEAVGMYMGIGTSQGILYILDLYTRGMFKEISLFSDYILSIEWKCKNVLLCECAKGIYIIDISLERVLYHSDTILKASIYPGRDRDVILVADKENVYTWDYTSNTVNDILLRGYFPIARYTSRGNIICIGSNNELHMFQYSNGSMRHSFHPLNHHDILDIFISSDESRIVVLSSSNRIFVHHILENTTTELRDIVNGIEWDQVCISPNEDDYLLCLGTNPATHSESIYIWDISSMTLVHHSDRLVNSDANITSIDWYDTQLSLLVVSHTDEVYVQIWTRNVSQDWTGFAPNFEQIHENVYYQEPEDEFDLREENCVTKSDLEAVTLDIDISYNTSGG